MENSLWYSSNWRDSSKSNGQCRCVRYRKAMAKPVAVAAQQQTHIVCMAYVLRRMANNEFMRDAWKNALARSYSIYTLMHKRVLLESHQSDMGLCWWERARFMLILSYSTSHWRYMRECTMLAFTHKNTISIVKNVVGKLFGFGQQDFSSCLVWNSIHIDRFILVCSHCFVAVIKLEKNYNNRIPRILVERFVYLQTTCKAGRSEKPSSNTSSTKSCSADVNQFSVVAKWVFT